MLTNKFYKYPIMLLMLAVVGLACSDTNNNSDSATVNGKVEQSQQAKALPEGTVVTMATVTANGTITALEDVETTTDANGEFSLSFDANTAQNYVVMAENGSSEIMGFLSANVENGQTIVLKPLDTESSAETNIFAELVSNGDEDIVLKSDIEAVITSNNSDEVMDDASLATQFAVALAASAEARADFFANEVEEDGQEKLENSIEILVDAQVRLENELYDASNTEEEEDAIDIFLETSANAFVDAEVEADKASQAISLWGRLVVNNVESMSDDVENEVRSQTSIMAAIALNVAVKAEAEASEMSENTQNDIESAGVQLMTDIRAALGVKSDIETSFEDFQESVEESMSNDSSVNGEFIISLNASINATSGAKTIFDNSIVSALSADIALDIFTSFSSNLFADSDDASTGEMSEANLEAVTTIMLLLNLTS